jgi:FHS family glucose/mannose:H+ symporter-like MFS transporter
MWGIGAIVCSPLVMLAQRQAATSWLLYTVAICSAVTAAILYSSNLEPGSTEEDALSLADRPNIGAKRIVSLAALFFLYVGSENSVAGWVGALTKRTNHGSGDLWALAPMFFWGGMLAGRALVPLLPLRRGERALLAGGLVLAAAAICVLAQTRTIAGIAIAVTTTGIGFAPIFPILIAGLVKAFRERSRQIGTIMFALAGMGGATMPWLVGLVSTGTGSLRAGLLVALAACVAMFVLVMTMAEPVFRGAKKQKH